MTAHGYEDDPPPDPPDSAGLKALQSAKSSQRLNQIDRVRANGVGDLISLPQLVVCGDQSAGKSSVLEGITTIPFPRQDGVCTKFATEIILRHSLVVSRVTATIIPHASRSEVEKERFRAYRRDLDDYSELPDIINEAAAMMKIRGFGDITDGPAFASDVLRIEVVGNTGLHLTVVDLPGLIAVSNEEQTEEDVALVADLVDSYLESSRTIILVVVQATIDIQIQGIIQRARVFDPDGQRTVGIITKADLINKGTEARIALLAKNKDTIKLKLGYFLLKNPSPSQLELGVSQRDRRRQEWDFFSSTAWKGHCLDMERVGIDALRKFLQVLLDRHIEKELPRVRKEIKNLLTKTEDSLDRLGEERPTVGHLRMFLTRLSMAYHNLAQGALEGNYHDVEFKFFDQEDDEEASNRLRAKVHRLNSNFTTYMHVDGQKRKVVDDDADSDLSEEDREEGQILVQKKDMNDWVNKVYSITRGRELPGNYNHVLLAELFHEQSSRWATLASGHINKIFELTEHFVKDALQRIIREEHVRGEVLQLASTVLAQNHKAAHEELKKIVDDEKQPPITYNHYYTDNIQNARYDLLKRAVQRAMKGAVENDWHGKLHVSNTPFDTDKLLASLQKRLVVNMDEQACAEALAGLNAYYKVALKTFIDNVCRQVVERHLLAHLPQVFSPPVVSSFSDEDLERIASEPASQREQRAKMTILAKGLRDSLEELHS